MNWRNSVPVVYHATEWGSEVIADRIIKGSPIQVREDLVHNRHHHGLVGISTTRDAHFARLYAPCVFVLDWSKARSRFKVIPRAEGAYGEHDYRLEAEELILTNGLSLSTYCLGIWADESLRNEPEFTQAMAHPLFRGFFKGHHG